MGEWRAESPFLASRLAEMILLDRSHPNLSSASDGVGVVVHGGRGTKVDAVIVGGRPDRPFHLPMAPGETGQARPARRGAASPGSLVGRSTR